MNRLFITIIIIFFNYAVYGQSNSEKIKLVIGTLEWAPYTSSKLLNDGFFSEICSRTFRKAGYTVVLKYLPWKRALLMAENGYVDCLYAAYYKKDREIYFYYSKPIDYVLNTFVTRKNYIPKYNTLKDLSTSTIGTIRGYAYTKEFDNATYLKKEAARDLPTNIKKLFSERVDLLIVSKKVFMHEININFENYKNKYNFLSPPLARIPLHIVFPKKNKNSKKIRDDFDKAFLELKKRNIITEILKKHGF